MWDKHLPTQLNLISPSSSLLFLKPLTSSKQERERRTKTTMAKIAGILFLLCVLPVLAMAGRPEKKPYCVRGKVYCDTCRAGFETPASTYLEGFSFSLSSSLFFASSRSATFPHFWFRSTLYTFFTSQYFPYNMSC